MIQTYIYTGRENGDKIQNPPDRYGVIHWQALHQLCRFSDYDQFAEQHRQWVQDVMSGGRIQREPCWTESIAVGSQTFIEEMKSRLGIRAKRRRIQRHPEEVCVLQEERVPYNADFAPENEALSAENASYWDDSLIVLDG